MVTKEQQQKYHDQIKKIISFRFLEEEEFESLLTNADLVQAQDGDVIIQDGEIDSHFYAVVDGSVSVTVRQNDKEVYISTIGSGQVFGEAGIFLKVKRTANVSAKGACTLLQIHRDAMMRFMKKYPHAGIKILMLVIYSLLYKLRESNQELAYERKADINQEDIDSFISEFLDK